MDIRIEKPLKWNAWLYGSIIDIDVNYFIEKINSNTGTADYKTNVKGKMTGDIFLKDPYFHAAFNKFKELNCEIADVLKPTLVLEDVWGVKNDTGDFTRLHKHGANHISGLFYLNHHPQLLEFPELKLKIKPEPGFFLVWHSNLWHKADPIVSKDSKYAVVFNLKYRNDPLLVL